MERGWIGDRRGGWREGEGGFGGREGKGREGGGGEREGWRPGIKLFELFRGFKII